MQVVLDLILMSLSQEVLSCSMVLVLTLNWIANVDARTARLTPFAGKKLLPESAYSIEINVQDAAGNPSQIHIVFVTEY